jgi:cell division ATPase FtsA
MLYNRSRERNVQERVIVGIDVGTTKICVLSAN